MFIYKIEKQKSLFMFIFGQTSIYFENLITHITINYPGIFKTQSFFDEHTKNFHGQKPDNSVRSNGNYHCEQCPKFYKSERQLKAHIEKYHGFSVIEKNPVKNQIPETISMVGCQFCSSIFKTEEILKEHVEKIHKVLFIYYVRTFRVEGGFIKSHFLLSFGKYYVSIYNKGEKGVRK